MKACLRCGVVKPLGNFFHNSWRPDGLTAYCKPCVSKVSREWGRRHPEKLRAYTLKRKYGLSIEGFLELVEQQGGRCAVCVRKFAHVKDGHVDHDHRSGKVRGVLCGSCNRGLGLFGDNRFVLTEAAAYLENFEARQ